MVPDSHDPVCVLKSGRGLATDSHTHKHSLKVKVCETLQCVIRHLGNPESLLVLLIFGAKTGFNAVISRERRTECIQQVLTEVRLMRLQK